MTLTVAVERFAAGAPVLVGDEQDDTIFAATAADTVVAEQLARLQELGHGTVVLGLGEQVAERLRLSGGGQPARADGGLRLMTPIDAATGISDGWSLRDRAHTMRVAASPDSGPLKVTVPGHVLPARIEEDGTHAAAAAIELARIAGHAPAVALCPVLDRAGAVLPLSVARADPTVGRMAVASSAELHSHAIGRRADEQSVTCELPTRNGNFRAIAFAHTGREPATIALIHGDPTRVERPLVHVHVACRFGDAFGSLLCDCRQQLDAAITEMIVDGCGVIIYGQPSQLGPRLCAREMPIDAALATGLLRAAGVRALRPTPRAAAMADALRRGGLEVRDEPAGPWGISVSPQAA